MQQNSNNKKWSNETKGMILATLMVVAGVGALTSSNFWSRKPASVQSLTTNISAPSVLQTSVVLQSSPPILETKEKELSFSHKTVDKLVLPATRTLFLLGQVDGNALETARSITEMSNDSLEPIYLILSGPGGSVLTGNILIAAIQASRAPVYTICDVLCASMDSMIHQYGKKRFMTDHTIIMFHPAAAGTQGDVDRMYSMVAFLKRYTNKIELDVAKRQGISFEQYKAKTAVELWIDSEDAFQEHINDGIVNYMVPKVFTFKADGNQEEQSKKRNDKSNTVITDSPIDVQWICKNCQDTKWATPKFY